jgi:hypothetical protein
MLKKTVTFEDYNGVSRTEDFFFNLTNAELAQLSMSKNGLDAYIERISKTRDQAELSNLFKKVLDMSYGIKSDDGRRFMKSPEILADFQQTEAYSIIYMELAQDADAALKFFQGIIPADKAKAIEDNQEAIQKANHPALR